MKSLLTRVQRMLERDRNLPVRMRVERIARSAAAFVAAPAFLSELDRLGPRARAFGRPRVDNRGSISAGIEFAVMSTFSPVELVAEPAGRIEIGDGVSINFGTHIVARNRVVIGDRVSIAPYCVVADDDANGGIEIGDDVWLAARVTVLAGSRIGARSVVSAGSVVRGCIPPDSLASGVPARVLRVFRASDARPQPFARSTTFDHDLALKKARALRSSLEARRRAFGELDAYRGLLWPGPSDAIDRHVELDGRPFVKNRGRIDWGDDVLFRSTPVQSHIVTGPSGHLRVGAGVTIDHGAAISVMSQVNVGDRTAVGPFVMILDSDYHDVKDHDRPGDPRPIVIGKDVRVGPRVTILRGAMIGDGAVIEADSVVCRQVPAGATAAGVPARPVA